MCDTSYMKLYVDTNIVLDFIWNRSSGLKPLGELAHIFFAESISCRHDLYISTHSLAELEKYIAKIHLTAFLDMISTKTTLIQVLADDLEKARSLEFHLSDALHLVLARKVGADAIVTRNLSDFPEEFAILSEYL